MNIKTIKRIATGATIAGVLLNFVANWAGEKVKDAELDAKVNEKVANAIQALTASAATTTDTDVTE